MARIVSIFQFTGRAGTAVGSKGKGGKVLLRQYQPTVANPRSAAQMGQRAKLKLASQVAGMLGAVGRTALVANGKSKTVRGTLVKQLLQNVRVSPDGTMAKLGYDLNLVQNPSYTEDITLVISNTANAFVATFSGAAEGEVIAKCILVHDLTTGTWRHASVMDTNTTLSIGKSANEAEDPLEVFAYGIVLQPKTTEGFSNIGQTGANLTGYIIDLNKVTNTNYDFSPCVSAALAVDPNGASGTTTGGTQGNTGNNGSSTGSETGGNSGNSGGQQSSNSQNGSSTSSTGSGTEGSETVAAPTISGTTPFEVSTTVTMSGPDGSAIHYTTDGSTPTAESTLYSEALTLTDTTTVKAIAIKDGVSSSVASQTFTKGEENTEGDD